MFRKIFSISISSTIAVLLTLGLLTGMARAGAGGAPSAVGANSASVSKIISGHAQTDQNPAQPVQNARVVAKEVVSGDIITETLTDAAGAYTLNLPDDVYACKVFAEVTAGMIPPEASPPTTGQLVTFPLAGGEKIANFTFSIPSSQIVGRVLIQGDPDIAPTFPVTVTAARLPGDSVSQVIEADGSFALTVLSGQYRVWFETVSPDYRAPLSQIGSIDAGETWDLGNIYLTPVVEFATLSGQVKLANGSPAPNAPVMALHLETTWPPVSSDSLDEAQTVWSDAEGLFTHTVRAGMWWVGVDFGAAGHTYMPHLTDWMTVTTVGPAGTVADIELVVDEADAAILGTLTEGEGGAQATDACGLAAVYKTDTPLTMVYNYKKFSGGDFNLPVGSGTYALAVQPNPDIDRLLGAIPAPSQLPMDSACADGKYLAKTVHGIEATSGVSTAITIALQTADVTLYGRLWDRSSDQVVTGVSGQVIGWQQGNWSGSQVDPATGSGELRVGPGTWLLSFHVDPDSGYLEAPGIVRVEIPTDTVSITVDLPLIQANAKITGTVTAPNGDPLARAAISAIGLNAPGAGGAGGAHTLTDADGHFTLFLDYGIYRLSVTRPPDWFDGGNGEPWINPEPQRVVLTPDNSEQELNLQFRLGDAVIHGQISLGESSAQKDLINFQMPAYVWAVAAGGHTRNQVPLSVIDKTGTYTLPVLQGERWTVGAAYLDRNGETLWLTETLVIVDAAEMQVDLTLMPTYSLTQGLAQSLAPAQAAFAEWADRISVYIPQELMPDETALKSTSAKVNPYYIITLRLKLFLLMDLFWPEDWPIDPPFPHVNGVEVDAAVSSTEMIPVSLPYEVSLKDAQGNPLAGELNPPIVVKMPYNGDSLSTSGFSADDLQPLYYNETTGGWEPMEDYVVDDTAEEVVIFASQAGSYALFATSVIDTPYRIYLPVVVK